MVLKFIRQIRTEPKAWLIDAFPICKWLPHYQLSYIPFDIIAGLTVGLTLLPISLAYAQLAYLRPEFGLYSSFLCTLLYIFLGTSKDAIIGPSAIGSMLLGQFNILNPLSAQGDNTYATILALISGCIMLVVGVFKLGFVVNLFSIPVVSGFTSAAAFSIIASQLRALLGIRKGPSDSPGVFVKQLKNLYDRRSDIRITDVTFGLVSLAVLLVIEYGHDIFLKCVVSRLKEPSTERGKKFKNILLTVLRLVVSARNVFVFIAGTVIAYTMHRQDPKGTEERMGLVGFVKPGFPLPTAPKFELYNITRVWTPFPGTNSTTNGTWVEKEVLLESTSEIMTKLSVGIIIIPLMGIMETFAILKAMGRKNGYRIDATQELVSIGLGNFLQSFIMGYPVAAATAKTALNDRCNVKTLLSTVLSVVIILVSLGSLTHLFYFVPKAVLAAILISAAHHLFDYNAAINIWKQYRPDMFLYLLTFLLCLFYDLAYGIVIAILINMVTFLKPVVSMHLSVKHEPLEILTTGAKIGDPNFGRVTIIQLSHGMKYPSVDKFIDRMSILLANSSDIHFVMDCRFVTGIDFTGMQAWRMLLQMALKNQKHLIFTNLSEPVRIQLVKIGLENFNHVGTIESAIYEFSTKAVGFKVTDDSADAMRERLNRTYSVIFSAEQARNNEAVGIAVGNDQEYLKEQEARILGLIQDSTAPRLYGDIPLTIGNAEFGVGDEIPTEITEPQVTIHHQFSSDTMHGLRSRQVSRMSENPKGNS